MYGLKLLMVLIFQINNINELTLTNIQQQFINNDRTILGS